MSNARTHAPWTPAQRDLLQKLRAQGMTYRELARRVGHSIESCTAMMSYIRCRHRRGTTDEATPPDPKPKLPNPRHNYWSADDSAALLHLRDIEKHPWSYISRKLGRTERACEDRYYLLTSKTAPPTIKGQITPEKIAYAKALRERTPAAALMNDPPAGYSALDQKRREAATP